ncbi:hypothetical protein MHBO_000776 [Bonamia ostreae]|uniref:Uncharacterized protein n=1 Tax=Bonamia ostreae TaxID=126728 RepID=A0ABV2AGS1_9EUKA
MDKNNPKFKNFAIESIFKLLLLCKNLQKQNENSINSIRTLNEIEFEANVYLIGNVFANKLLNIIKSSLWISPKMKKTILNKVCSSYRFKAETHPTCDSNRKYLKRYLGIAIDIFEENCNFLDEIWRENFALFKEKEKRLKEFLKFIES